MYKNIMNKTQKITVALMVIFGTMMLTESISLNSDNSVFAAPRHHVITAIAVLVIIAVTAALVSHVSHATNLTNATQVATNNH
jgi:hypothetical protein